MRFLILTLLVFAAQAQAALPNSCQGSSSTQDISNLTEKADSIGPDQQDKYIRDVVRNVDNMTDPSFMTTRILRQVEINSIRTCLHAITPASEQARQNLVLLFQFIQKYEKDHDLAPKKESGAASPDPDGIAYTDR